MYANSVPFSMNMDIFFIRRPSGRLFSAYPCVPRVFCLAFQQLFYYNAEHE